MKRALLVRSLTLTMLAGVAVFTIGRAVSRAFLAPESAGYIYAVSALQATLRQHPAAWSGKVVFVRGDAALSSWLASTHDSTSETQRACYHGGATNDPLDRWCPLLTPDGHPVSLVIFDDPPVHDAPLPFGLSSPYGARPFLTLRTQLAPPSSLARALHWLPWIGRFVSVDTPATRIIGGVPHIFRIRLLPPHPPCNVLVVPDCADAVLAAPPG